jgi:hypothetical protein
MFIEWKKYQDRMVFTSGKCSVIFDMKGNTYLKVDNDYIPFESVYFKKHGKEVMSTIMTRAIPQLSPNAIKNPTEMDIVSLNNWKKDLRPFPAIYKRISILLNEYKKELKRLAKGE